ncbi:MAG: bifunctional phosphopantothenoylcysteine decarboxylase/phosphopantothenate--cysteine ligase CoaBC [Dehalococcoidia bacterium]|nr:bifunctional phosphopantothenoylcysteine decarboxylase/phosphopantothenate--cysteine ligase CoaBC [Dehalococcoidia bacterium]
MSNPLTDRRIVLGVSGSIAAYKAAEITSRLVQAGAEVDVALTRAATEFITPLTFRSLTAREPYVDMFRPHGEYGEAHVELARQADLMVIAPATASTMARLVNGLADDFVSLTALATQAPILIAPAMDSQMWEHEATRANRYTLEGRGVTLVGPVPGRLASGRIGSGRMAEPATIVDAIKVRLGQARGDLAARRIVVTAGGTREAIDPVRYVGNHSSGKMGYAIAEAARDRGAEVILITTAALPDPHGVRVVRVESALELQRAVEAECPQAKALVMAAAVADYRPSEAAEQKMKRADASELAVDLVENPDVIALVSGDFVKIAFAAETENLIENAIGKLERKGAQLIVANDVTATDAGFGTDTNRVTILDRDGGAEILPLMSKYEVAVRVLDRVAALLADQES